MINFGARSKVINEKEFKVEPFNVRTAFRMQAKLARIFGPALACLMPEKGLDSNVDFSKLLAGLFEELTEDAFDKLISELLSRAFLIQDGQMLELRKDEVLNLAFLGSTMDLYKVIWFVLEVNYPDFLSQVGDFGSLLKTDSKSKVNDTGKKSVRRSAN